jgi:hypothetical protein
VSRCRTPPRLARPPDVDAQELIGPTAPVAAGATGTCAGRYHERLPPPPSGMPHSRWCRGEGRTRVDERHGAGVRIGRPSPAAAYSATRPGVERNERRERASLRRDAARRRPGIELSNARPTAPAAPVLGKSGQAAERGRPRHVQPWLGLAVDVPTQRIRWVIDRIGRRFGFAKAWSDAPWGWGHLCCQPDAALSLRRATLSTRGRGVVGRTPTRAG